MSSKGHFDVQGHVLLFQWHWWRPQFLQLVLAESVLTDQVLWQKLDSETQAEFQYKAMILKCQNKKQTTSTK